ncbi:RidA family protein [Sinorhizobium meliloti]|nr:hypothetical protein [Sinorhizobium meliloti]
MVDLNNGFHSAPDTTAGLSAVTTTDAPAAIGPCSQAIAVNGELFVT